MSTTIDSLQIEIQTSSSNAAAGIDALAASLERLKKVGSFNVVIKNLNSLSTSLKNLQGVSGAGTSLQSIATAINTLKSAGSFGSIASSFKKLSDSVNGLSSADIDAFVAKVKELDDKLEPVSKKLVAIGNAFKAVNTNANKTGSGFSKFGGKVNTTTMNLSNFINVAKSVISSFGRIIKLFEKTIGDAIEWDGITQRFGRGFGDQADDVYSWIQELNKEMGINAQQFMQYSSTYATMLKGFGVASEDASKMALGYMELTYDVWSGYNDIYKSLDDAATAIRSAIAGEVEPVRKAGFTIIESTLEQTAANHGLKISLEKATEAQKSYLRYLTLVDQAKAQDLIGNYAREMNTAEGVMRTFNQQVKSLGQTFGSLFLPILVKVMPWVQAFISLINEAIVAVASLFGVEIQTVNFGSSISSSANDATESVNGTTAAMKELKNATTGIDELNIISPQSGGGGGASVSGGGFEGLDINSLWDRSIFDTIQSDVDEIKGKFKEWLGITDDITSWSDIFKTKLGNILVVVGLIGAALVVWKVIESIANVIDVIGKLKGVGGKNTTANVGGGGGLSGTTDKLKTLIKDLALGLVVILEAAAAAALVVGAIWLLGVELEQVGIAWEPVIANGETVAIAMGVGTVILAAVGAAAYGLGTLGATVALNVGIGIAILAEIGVAAGLFIAEIWGIGVLLNEVYKAWNPVLANGKEIATAIGVGTGLLVGIGVVAAALGVATVASAGLLPVAIALGTALLVELAVAVIAFTESLVEVADTMSDELYPSMHRTNEILPGLSKDMRDFTSFMGTFAGEVVKYTASSSIAGIAATIDKFISFFTTDPVKKMAKDVDSQIDDFDFLNRGLETIIPKIKKATTLIKDYNSAMGSFESASSKSGLLGNLGITKSAINGIISGIEALTNGVIRAINGMINALNKLSFTIPSWVPSLGGKTFGLNLKTLSTISIPRYKTGGFPEDGLFMANSGELVGKFSNGRTAVVNNEQIVESVSQGVYQAVVAAMRASNGNSGSQSVNVYLDGRQITASVEQRQKERGASLMGNQVYAY